LRGKVEVLLTKQLSTSPLEWEALVHPGRKLELASEFILAAMPTNRRTNWRPRSLAVAPSANGISASIQ